MIEIVSPPPAKRGRPKKGEKRKPGPKPKTVITRTIVKRGDVPTDDKGNPWCPTAQQIKIATLLLDIDDKRPKYEKCKEAGVSPASLTNWNRDPNFVGWLNDQLKVTAKGELTEMYRYLKTACKRGNVQAIRLWFELAGALSPQKVELTGKDGQPIQASGNFSVVFGTSGGMAEPPGKRIETEYAIDVESEVIEDEEEINSGYTETDARDIT